MFAELWEEDRMAKSKREEMEAAMQLERNREMLRVKHGNSFGFVLLCDIITDVKSANSSITETKGRVTEAS